MKTKNTVTFVTIVTFIKNVTIKPIDKGFSRFGRVTKNILVVTFVTIFLWLLQNSNLVTTFCNKYADPQLFGNQMVKPSKKACYKCYVFFEITTERSYTKILER